MNADAITEYVDNIDTETQTSEDNVFAAEYAEGIYG